jgi:hypothetical protein
MFCPFETDRKNKKACLEARMTLLHGIYAQLVDEESKVTLRRTAPVVPG